MNVLEERVALVTGGGSGIGRATSFAFARAGASVAVADIDEAGAAATVAEIERTGGVAMALPVDVASSGAVDDMVAAVVAAWGRLDVAHNNAGIEGAFRKTGELTDDEWERVVSVNLSAVWRCMRAELAPMVDAGAGAIVNTASILGLTGFTHSAAYAAAKHGVVGLTRVAALEYARRGIRVNAVCPGFVETPMLLDRGLGAGGGAFLDQVLARVPARRLGQPDEVADAVVWLCSDAASYVNGHALAVDGGFLAG